MINLDQVRTLEWKVKQAVQLIVQLRRENDMLRGRLADTEVRLQELESMVEAFKVTQSQMESGIRSALDELDHLDAEGQVDHAPPADESRESVGATDLSSAEPERVLETQAAVESEPALDTEPGVEPALDADEAFEEEYAALVAEEAASLVEDPKPLEDAPEAAAEVESDPSDTNKGPDQPGLGIF